MIFAWLTHDTFRSPATIRGQEQMSQKNDVSLDRHRPTFHFLPPSNWMNDPNGLIQWNGTYHLFYQYNPNGAFWGTMHWGHASSGDLVNWTHLPIALAPTPNGPDADGCFSGVAVDVNGQPTLMYTGVRGNDQLPCIATSRDDDLSSWEKLPDNPVIASPPAELETTIFRDHSVWKENATWHQVIGSGVRGIGGTALVYRSEDFLSWSFVDSLISLDRVAVGIGKDATGWECPDFFGVDGRHVLIAAMWDHRPICVAWFVGDYENERFTPTNEGVVDGGESFYAPQSFTDDTGRRVMFGWLRENRPVQAQIDAGWSGAMSLPRILTVLADGSLGTTPAPEVQQLRGRHMRLGPEALTSGSLDLDGIAGDALEMLVELSPEVTGSVVIDVLRSEDGSESTEIMFDADAGRLSVDTRRSTFPGNIEGGVYSIDDVRRGESPVLLHVFVDHSVVEVFLNDEKCITARAYPSRPDSVGCQIASTTGATAFRSVDIWEMQPCVFTDGQIPTHSRA
jgi:beta-fructofuranosidase